MKLQGLRLVDLLPTLLLGCWPPLTKQDLCPALHAGASFCLCSCMSALPQWVAGSTCMCVLHIAYVLNMLVLAQLKVPAPMQEHCVAALLRLHKKQIMRLRSPEDFIQVQPLRVTACNILHSHSNSCLTALQHLAHGFTRCCITVVMLHDVMQQQLNRPKILLINSD